MRIIEAEEKEMNQFLGEHRDSDDESEDDDEKSKPLPSPSLARKVVEQPKAPSPIINKKEVVPETAPEENEKVVEKIEEKSHKKERKDSVDNGADAEYYDEEEDY